MRYFIQLQYKGTNYHGWQVQPNATTVQATVQDALSKILGQPMEIIGAGRTDTGVHASFFIAHFDTGNQVDTTRLCHSLDRIVPHDISIQKVFPVSDDVHSRFSAISRTYKYFINQRKNPFMIETSTYLWGNIDIDLMNHACKILFNHSDFTSFSKLHTDTATNNCHIMLATWETTDSGIVFTIKADRFLRNMVRAIVGTMLDLGRHKITLRQFEDIIISKNRCSAGISAPPQGLFLVDIEYPRGIIQNN